MRVRQLAGAAAVAVLAAVAVPGALAAPASAATPGYVGIVITGAGQHAAYCVRWHSGITGDEILNDVAAVRYRSDGIILTIDGAPATAKADDTHYWSYWRDTTGSWTYSSVGASGTRPAAGSVDGWSFVDGSQSAPAPQYGAAGLYASLCGSLGAPPVTRVPVRSSPPASHSAAAPRTSASVAATSTSRAASSTAPATSSASSATRHDPSSSATDVVVIPAGAGGDSGSAASSPVAAVRHHSSRGSVWPTVIAVWIGAALLAGAAALVWTRRQAL